MDNATLVAMAKSKIKDTGVTRAAISKKTNIAYPRLQRILNCGAKLTASEFISLFRCLGFDLNEFKEE